MTSNKKQVWTRGGLAVAALAGLAALGCDNTALVGAQDAGAAGASGAAGVGAAGAGGSAGGATGSAGANANGFAGAAGGVTGGGATGGVTGGGATGGAPVVDHGPGPTSAGWLFFDSLRGLNRDIYAVRADGSQLTRITTSPATEREPAVSPDGKLLAYASDETGVFQLYVKQLPDGAPRQLTTFSQLSEQPAWSPDGSQLVFHSDSSAWLVGLDGQPPRMVPPGQDYNSDLHPVFTPDGRALLADRNNQINRVDLVTGAETPVIHNSTTTIEHPTVSPDGHSVAFDVYCGDLSIWIAPIAADTVPCQGGSRVAGPGRYPSFSADGLIAFENNDANARIEVVMPGGDARTITQGGDDRNPHWAPAGFDLP
jgi:Tol biopolymer transport system component